MNLQKMVLGCCMLMLGYTNLCAQTNETTINKLQLGLYDGIIATGYVDHGAYLNFTGPNINYSFKQLKLIVGMLPTLRIKEDQATVKNALVTPTLGMGLTLAYKKLVIQWPFYYNAKTSTVNGNWKMGVGIGYRFR